MASKGKNTMQGIKALAPGMSDEELTREVSAILSPDALTALKRRSKNTTNDKGGGSGDHRGRRKSHSPRRGESSRDHRPRSVSPVNSSSRSSHHQKMPAPPRRGFDGDIVTTHDMAEEVSSILGPEVLSALGHKDPKSIKPRHKSSSHEESTAPRISAKTLKAMEKTKSSIEKDLGYYDIDDEEEEEGDEHQQIEERRKERAHQRKGDKGPQSPKRPTNKNNLSRAKTSDGATSTSPKKPSHHHTRRVVSTDGAEPSPRSRKPRNRDAERRGKDLPNPAEAVTIDLEDGLDDYVGELGPGSPDEDKKQHRSPGKTARVRKPGRVRSHDDGRVRSQDEGHARGARKGGRRGQQRDIRQQQLTQMTHVDQNKQFREEDILRSQSTEEEEDQEDEDTNQEGTERQQRTGFGILAPTAVAAAAANVAVTGATATAGAVYNVASTAGDTVLNVGGKVGGTVYGGATVTAGAVYTVASTAGGTVLNVGGLVGGTVYNVLNTAAAAATSSTATATKPQELEDYGSSDDDDDHNNTDTSQRKSLAPTWGFSHGGMAD